MMEDEKTTNKHGKKKIHTSLGSITIGGEGGITGLLVFGGALAIAGFMAVTSFGSKKQKKKPIIHPHHQQLLLDDDNDSLVQYSATQFEKDATSCLKSNECTKTVSSSELLSAQPLILKEKINNESNNACFHPQEFAFSDHSHPESASSSNENGIAEESSGEEEKDEPQDGLTTTETEDEPQDSLTTTETENTDDDDVTETDKDSSKATETTSLDDKEELIEQEFKKHYCESNVCSDLYADDGLHYAGNEDAVQKEAILNKTANLLVLQNDQQSILTTWVMPILMLGLLMLLVMLTRGLQESLNVLDDAIL